MRSSGHFEWYVVNLLAFVVAVYAGAIRRKQWGDVQLAVGFWAGEFIWEMFNALVLRATGEAALWTVLGNSTLLIYVGLNLEIALMFGVMPLVLFALIDGTERPVAVATGLGLFCVATECVLNQWGALGWHWWFWRWPMIPLIAVAYCAPLVGLAWMRAHAAAAQKRRFALLMPPLALALHVLLVGLGWV